MGEGSGRKQDSRGASSLVQGCPEGASAAMVVRSKADGSGNQNSKSDQGVGSYNLGSYTVVWNTTSSIGLRGVVAV